MEILCKNDLFQLTGLERFQREDPAFKEVEGSVCLCGQVETRDTMEETGEAKEKGGKERRERTAKGENTLNKDLKAGKCIRYLEDSKIPGKTTVESAGEQMRE